MPDNAVGSEVLIRRIRSDEWKLYRDIRLRALESDPLAFGTTLNSALERNNSFWIERAMRNATSSTESLWIAQHSDIAVGIAGIFPVLQDFHLYHMWVDPGFRRLHIGVRLMDSAIGWVKSEHPSAVIKLNVNKSQFAAIRLYVSRGFVPTGHEENLPHTPEEIIQEMALKHNL